MSRRDIPPAEQARVGCHGGDPL